MSTVSTKDKPYRDKADFQGFALLAITKKLRNQVFYSRDTNGEFTEEQIKWVKEIQEKLATYAEKESHRLRLTSTTTHPGTFVTAKTKKSKYE